MKVVVWQAKVSKSLLPIAVGKPIPCPEVVGVEAAVIGSSRLHVIVKVDGQGMGTTSVHVQGQGGTEAIAADRYASEAHSESSSKWVAREEQSVCVRSRGLED